MAKKKEKKGKIKLNSYLKEFFSFLLSLLEESTGDLIRRFGDIIHFRKKVRKYFIFFMLASASLVIMLFGIADFIGSFFPKFRPGIIYILLGIFTMLMAYAYKQSR